MNTATIRRQLHQYIDNADDRKVKGLFMFIEDEINAQDAFSLTEEQLEMIKEEKEKHIKRESPSYSWENAKQIIRGKKRK